MRQTFVSLKMSLQIARQCEALVTDGAAVWLVSSVKQQVVLQVRLLAEAATTDAALVRPRAAVHVHVAAEVARRWERLRAQCAFVRFFL